MVLKNHRFGHFFVFNYEMSDYCTVLLKNCVICSSAEFRKVVGTSTPLQHALGTAGIYSRQLSPRALNHAFGERSRTGCTTPPNVLLTTSNDQTVNRDGPDLGSAATTAIANDEDGG